MPAEELAEILEFVQPGRVIEQAAQTAKIYQFVTENGTNLGTVAEETVTGSNGILYRVINFIAETGTAGVYVTKGLAAIPVELSVASSIWMSVIGVMTGVGLYNMFPDFWNWLSDSLFGTFVDGLPVLFLDHNGVLRVQEDTINIVKDIALRHSLYEKTNVNPSPMAASQFNTYLTRLSEHTITFASNDKATVSEFFDFINNYHTLSTYYDAYGKGQDLQKIFNLIFSPDSEIPGGAVRRQKLLSWLNTYYDYTKDFLLIRTWSSANSEINPLAPYDVSVETYSREFITKVLNGESFKHWDENDHFVNGPIEINATYNFQQFLFNSTEMTCRYTPFDKFYHRNGNVVETYLPFEYFSHYFRLYDTYVGETEPFPHDLNYADTFYNPDTGETLQASDYDYYDVVQSIPAAYNFPTRYFIPEALKSYSSFHGYTNEMTSVGIHSVLTNEPYTWVYPDTIKPNETDPVTTTYPDWGYITVPGIGNLLEVTPPEVSPAPSQEAAQNPDPWSDPAKWLDYIRKILSEVFPDPEPQPDPAPDPEPAPQPSPEPGPAPSPDPVPGPDPEPAPDPGDPNTPVEPDPTPIIDPVLPSVDSSRLFTVYWPTANQLDELGSYLWSTNFITAIEKIWQDPMAAIISLRKVYATPLSSETNHIILGYLDSGVTSRIVSSQFVTQSCGYLNISEVMHNATDYSPYTQSLIYLPFIGIHEIDIDEIMGGRITVRYHFDLYTGVCLAEIIVLRSDLTPEKMLYSFSGNAAQEIPLTGTNAQGFFNTLMTLGGSALAISTGGALGAAAGATALGHSLTHEMMHLAHSGNLSANAGIMGNRYPQLILTNRNRYDANAYSEIYGYPANKTVYLGNCRGFTRVKAINLQTYATQQEKDEIEELLRNGVIF